MEEFFEVNHFANRDGHTRRRYGDSTFAIKHQDMLIKRTSKNQTFEENSNGFHGLPVTEVDSIFDANFINIGTSCRSLKSDEDLQDILEAMEDCAIKVVKKYNAFHNCAVTTFEVPVIGHYYVDTEIMNKSKNKSSEKDGWFLIRGNNIILVGYTLQLVFFIIHQKQN